MLAKTSVHFDPIHMIMLVKCRKQIYVKNGNSEKIVHDEELGINKKKTVLKKKKTPFIILERAK